MDLKKYNKPIHFTCPKCHADFEFNGGELARRKEELGHEQHVLLAKIAAEKNRNPGIKTPYYRQLVKRLEESRANYSEIKSAVRLASENAELQVLQAFKKEIRRRLGDEVVNKILAECEAEMSFNDYDTAIQNHNNFENA